MDFIFKMYYKVGCNFFIMAYRGYSNSEGVPSETGIKLDAHAAMEYIMSRTDVIDTKKVFVMGRSLGGAVATYVLASGDYKVRGAILENTFTSIDDMVDKIFPYVSFFKRWILRNHWRTIDLVGKLSVPILFIIAQKDELVPPEMSERLYNKASLSEKKFRVMCDSNSV